MVILNAFAELLYRIADMCCQVADRITGQSDGMTADDYEGPPLADDDARFYESYKHTPLIAHEGWPVDGD